MNDGQLKESINERYSKLANTNCCFSCGGAINFADITSGEVCADLGSGHGTDVIRMAMFTGETGFVYGIDISDGMLKKAEETAAKMNVKNIKLIKSDLENIRLDDNTVDVLISNCTINHSLNQDQVWSEIYRILIKNGRFIVSDIYSINPVPEKYRSDPKAVAECWAGAVTREKYIATLEKTGFRNIEILEESKPYDKATIKVASFTIKGKK